MKNKLFTILIIFLTIISGFNGVSGENETLAVTNVENEEEIKLKIKN